MRAPAPSIRAKVLLLSVLLMALPWFGYQFVRQIETYLRATLEATVANAAQTIAIALHGREELFGASAPVEDTIFAPTLPRGAGRGGGPSGPAADLQLHALGRDTLVLGRWAPGAFGVSWGAGSAGQHLYLLFRVHDPHVVYASPPFDADTTGDHLVLLSADAAGRIHRYLLATSAPGPILARELLERPDGTVATRPEPRIHAEWRSLADGYQVAVRMPYSLLQGRRLGFTVYDFQTPEQQLPSRVLVSAPAAINSGTSALLLPSAELTRLVERLSATAGRRVSIVGRHGWVLASGGSLALPHPAEPVNSLIGMLLPAPDEADLDTAPAGPRMRGAFIDRALAGHTVTRWLGTRAPGIYLVAAAAPVRSQGQVVGAVVVEDTSAGILLLRRRALASLFDISLAVGVFGGIALLLFATRISWRLRRLRRASEQAIDPRGRVVADFERSFARDEIGDVARAFAAMLERLRQYNAYLENLAGRLSHELRTPIAVVRSSLDSLSLDPDPSRAEVYAERARHGLHRLDTIITRMSEASRLERTLEGYERELFDIDAVLTSTVAGYRATWPDRRFEFAHAPAPVYLHGAPELIVQMLDKLVSNALDFSAPRTPIRLRLEQREQSVVLAVENTGPPLPATMESRLFESMVSVRPKRGDGEPHLGLGLYVVRLIATFHGGEVRAEDLADGSGVRFSVQLPAYTLDNTATDAQRPRPRRARSTPPAARGVPRGT